MIFYLSTITRTAPALLIALTLAACAASPTPYQVIGQDGGYDEQQLETDRYRVKFEGNTATPREVVEDFALYRAAELTLETGNDHFRVVAKDVEPVAGTVRGVSPRFGIGIGGGGSNVGVGLSTFFGGGGRADVSYVTFLDVVVGKGEKPEGDRSAYNAFDVIDRLKPNVIGAGEEAAS